MLYKKKFAVAALSLTAASLVTFGAYAANPIPDQVNVYGASVDGMMVNNLSVDGSPNGCQSTPGYKNNGYCEVTVYATPYWGHLDSDFSKRDQTLNLTTIDAWRRAYWPDTNDNDNDGDTEEWDGVTRSTEQSWMMLQEVGDDIVYGQIGEYAIIGLTGEICAYTASALSSGSTSLQSRVRAMVDRLRLSSWTGPNWNNQYTTTSSRKVPEKILVELYPVATSSQDAPLCVAHNNDGSKWTHLRDLANAYNNWAANSLAPPRPTVEVLSVWPTGSYRAEVEPWDRNNPGPNYITDYYRIHPKNITAYIGGYYVNKRLMELEP